MTETASVSNITLADSTGAPPVSYGIRAHDIDGSDTGVATMSFGDFLDMVNPLQHIPVLSSIYRDATGDTINPVSRIAGDTMYAGIMGVASAGVGALAAIGSEIFAANNDGQSAPSALVTALFGKDDPSTTKLASAATPTATDTPTQQPAPQLALLQTPATQSAILQMPDLDKNTPVVAAVQPAPFQPTSTQIAAAQVAAKSSPIPAAAAQAAAATSDPSLGLALNRSKPAYGGVMDTAMMQNAMQNQTLALALANGKSTMQGEHSVRNSRFATPAAAPTDATANATAPATTTAATTVAASSTSDAAISGATASQPIPQSLIDDLRTMQGLGRYRSSAQSLPVTGSSVDVVN
jgi:hypothetical protein